MVSIVSSKITKVDIGGVVLFQNQFLTGIVSVFKRGEILFKSGFAFKQIRYSVYFILEVFEYVSAMSAKLIL